MRFIIRTLLVVLGVPIVLIGLLPWLLTLPWRYKLSEVHEVEEYDPFDNNPHRIYSTYGPGPQGSLGGLCTVCNYL